MTAPKSTRARPVRVPVGVVPHVTEAELTGHVPASVDFSALPDSQTHVPGGEPDGAVGVLMPATRPEIVRGTRVLYTNRLGVGPWPGVVEDAHVVSAGVPCCWLRVTKPNGNEFFTAAPLGDGPDTFTLAD